MTKDVDPRSGSTWRASAANPSLSDSVGVGFGGLRHDGR